MFYVNIKSGTSGWSDYDNCDKQIAEIPSDNIPSIGDTLEIDSELYLVREVRRAYNLPPVTFGEWIYVYVIKI